MLSDQEIRTLAEAHLQQAYRTRATGLEGSQGFELIRMFDLDDPCGVYFAVESSDTILLGDGGFLVDRSEGSILHFGSGDLVRASRALNPGPMSNPGSMFPQVTPSVIQFLLKHPEEASPSSVGASAYQGVSRKWWQFWK